MYIEQMRKRLRDTYGLCNVEIDLVKGEDKECQRNTEDKEECVYYYLASFVDYLTILISLSVSS